MNPRELCCRLIGSSVCAESAMIPDRLHQGMLDALCAMKLIRTSLSTDAMMTNEYTKQSFVNPDTVNYYGNRCDHSSRNSL